MSKEYRKRIKMPTQGLHHDHGKTVVAKLGKVGIIFEQVVCKVLGVAIIGIIINSWTERMTSSTSRRA